jgi:hypothetical protein
VWAKWMVLNQDPCMPSHTLQARNYLFACFAVSLIRGETIQGRLIRHATVWNYVTAAIHLHIDRSLPSPHHAETNYIKIVLKAISKFEEQPNHRDMMHDKVVHHIESQRHLHPPDTLDAALADWL